MGLGVGFEVEGVWSTVGTEDLGWGCIGAVMLRGGRGLGEGSGVSWMVACCPGYSCLLVSIAGAQRPYMLNVPVRPFPSQSLDIDIIQTLQTSIFFSRSTAIPNTYIHAS